MRLAGMPVGPRRSAGVVIIAGALVAVTGITHAYGLGWGLVMVGAGLGLLALLLGLTHVEVRRQRSAAVPRHDAVRQSIGVLGRSAAGAAANADTLAEQVTQDRGERADEVSRKRAELRQGIRSLGAAVEARSAALDDTGQHMRDTLAQLRAEQRGAAASATAVVGKTADGEIELIRNSALFDPTWYAEQAHHRHRCDLGSTDLDDLVRHYVYYGASAGLSPHPLFAPAWYLDRHPDALHHWRTPLAHSLENGFDPHPAFWSRWYADRYLSTGFPRPPVTHFLEQGAAADFNPNPLFDVPWYRETYRELIGPDDNPLSHYLTVGAPRDLDPSPLFRTPDVRRRIGAAIGDPLSTFFAAETVFAAGQQLRHRPDASSPDHRSREDDRRWEYLTRGLYRERDTFVLYRIIGNDLPPRHREGQSLENLRFILENEPALPGCRKRWVVNRIVDPEQEKQVISLLEAARVPYIHIPFRWDEYRDVGWHFEGLPKPGFTYRREFDNLGQDRRRRVLDHLYHDKNRYVMNNNGARNAALREGRQLAKWVLPWDGNCFVTGGAWEEIVEAIGHRPYLKYFSVPMARVLDNRVLLEPDPGLAAGEEPQIVFRQDAEEEFDPDARYGYRPKVILLNRLGVAGPWDRWTRYPWEPVPPEPSPQAGPVGQAGWVARLYSGQQHLETNLTTRGVRRTEAIWHKIDELDEMVARETFDATELFAIDEAVLARQRARYEARETGPYHVVTNLISEAEQALGHRLYCVTEKTSLPPSGDPHDYWHPAPYFWPNPDRPDGLPYVYRDDQRVPGTQLWEPGSEQYDRSSLQSMIDESWRLALAGYFTADARFHARGAALLRTWFLDPQTRMNPHLRYAQVAMGHHGDLGSPAGIIETKDFSFLLDAARLIERSGELTAADAGALRDWFREYRTWLENSDQGRAERSALNNHGTWYDVQMIAVDAYLDDVPGLLATLRRSHERAGQQIEPDGRQPEELQRTLTQHYCAYNLQGWTALAAGAARVGQDLWNYRSSDGRGISPAAGWLLQHMDGSWPYPQIDHFDPDRLVVLAVAAAAGIPTLDKGRTGARDTWAVKQVFTAHEGVRPYWLLGSAAGDRR